MRAVQACAGVLAAVLLVACAGGTTSPAPGGAALHFSPSVRGGDLGCLTCSPQLAVDACALATDRAGVRLGVTGAGRIIATWAEQRGGRGQVQVAVSPDASRWC